MEKNKIVLGKRYNRLIPIEKINKKDKRGWNEELVPKETVEEEFLKENTGVSKEDPDFKDKLEEYLNDDDKTYYTYEEFNDYDYIEYETYADKYNTPNGDTVVAFGYYGENY